MLAIFPWQKQNWQYLMAMHMQQRMPHALLLFGPDGIGLTQFARVLSMQLLCLNKHGIVACQNCQSCQLYLAGHHPDCLVLTPEKTSRQIKINEIRQVLDYVRLKSFAGDTKVCIINPADAMNKAATNALLKTLEEPPIASKLILITHQLSKLPVTIRSRCQHIDFKPVYDNEAKDWLSEQIKQQQYQFDNTDILLQLSHGGPLKALALLNNDSFLQRKKIYTDLELIFKGQTDIAQTASEWQKLDYHQVLSYVLYFIADLVKIKLLENKASLVNTDLKEDLKDLAKVLDLRTLVHNYNFIQTKLNEGMSVMNFNPLNMLETIIIQCNPN